jgi:hypothetical protein
LFLSAPSPIVEAGERNVLIPETGAVFIKSLGSDWRSIQQEEELAFGDIIKTGANARAEILLKDLSVIRISENTELGIQELSLAKENGSLSVFLQEGRIWTHIFEQKNAPFEVQTNTSKLSMSYGVFDISAKEFTQVRALKNSLVIESENSEPLTVSAGYFARVNENSAEKRANMLQKDVWTEENIIKDDELRVLKIEEQKEEKDGSFFRKNELEKAKEEFATMKKLSQEEKYEEALQKFSVLHTSFASLLESEFLEDTQKFLQHENALFNELLPGDILFPVKLHFYEMMRSLSKKPLETHLSQLQSQFIQIQALALTDIKSSVLIPLVSQFSEYNQSFIETSLQDNVLHLESLLYTQNTYLQELERIKKQVSFETQGKITVTQDQILKNMNTIVQNIAPVVMKNNQMNTKQAKWFFEEIQKMVEKVTMYETETGRTNTITHLLSQIEDTEKNIPFLAVLKEQMPEDVREMVTQKIQKIVVKNGEL